MAGSLVGAVAVGKTRTVLSSVLTMASCGFGFGAAVEVLYTGHHQTLVTNRILPFGGLNLSVDRFAALFIAVTAVVGICTMVFRLAYDGHGLDSRSGSSILPLFVTSLLLVPAAAGLTSFLFLWETMAITSLLLILANHRSGSQVHCASHWYAAMTQFGAAALFVAFVVLATATHSQSFSAMATRAAHLSPWLRSSVFLLAVVGFGSKAGMVPLHVWLPRAHSEAPSPLSALMSTAMVNLGIYGIVRVGDGLLGGGPAWWWMVAMSLGAISALFGSLHSATSSDIKRLLAYSTTDNIGLILVGVGASGMFDSTGHSTLAALALTAALLHLVFHAAFKGSLFLSAGSMQQATGTRDLDQLGGLLRRMPFTGAIFIVGSTAIAAMPPLCGFVSEWLLLQSMLQGLPSKDPIIALSMPIGVGVPYRRDNRSGVRKGYRDRVPGPTPQR